VSYAILIPDETRGRAGEYLASLQSGVHKSGAKLGAQLHGRDLGAITLDDLFGNLFETKKG